MKPNPFTSLSKLLSIKLPKVNNHPVGEFSPNLATLLAAAKPHIQEYKKLSEKKESDFHCQYILHM
jgi:hypothetical protein